MQRAEKVRPDYPPPRAHATVHTSPDHATPVFVWKIDSFFAEASSRLPGIVPPFWCKVPRERFMRFASWCVAVSLLLPSVAPSVPMAAEAMVLRPYIGETVQEFEARKRGIRLDPADGKGGVLTVPADTTGHFYVEPTLGGQRIRMLVDTGASLVALSHEDAERMSLSVSARDFTHQISTANGVVEAAPVRIPQIQVGDIVVRNVEAVVLPPGRLNVSLLGMTFLRRLSTFEITDGRLALRQ